VREEVEKGRSVCRPPARSRPAVVNAHSFWRFIILPQSAELKTNRTCTTSRKPRRK